MPTAFVHITCAAAAAAAQSLKAFNRAMMDEDEKETNPDLHHNRGSVGGGVILTSCRKEHTHTHTHTHTLQYIHIHTHKHTQTHTHTQT